MDEMIRSLLSEPPPSAAAIDEARRRLHEEIAGRRPRKRMTWRLSLATGGLAAVVAAGVALAAGPTTPGVQGVPAPPGPDATAPQLLLAAAERAAKPAGSGRYWRVLLITKSREEYMDGRAGGETFGIGRRDAQEAWLPKDPKDGNWAGMQHLGVFPWSAEDRAAWERAGSPTQFEAVPDRPVKSPRSGPIILSTKPRPGHLQQVDADWRVEVYNLWDPFELAKLPSDPVALRSAADAKLKETGRDDNGDSLALYVMMTELLKYAPATPELRSAAFTVLSEIPEIRNLGEREDATGRKGIALGYGDIYIILNAEDYTILGYGLEGRDYDTSVIKLGWTDDKPAPPAME